MASRVLSTPKAAALPPTRIRRGLLLSAASRARLAGSSPKKVLLYCAGRAKPHTARSSGTAIKMPSIDAMIFFISVTEYRSELEIDKGVGCPRVQRCKPCGSNSQREQAKRQNTARCGDIKGFFRHKAQTERPQSQLGTRLQAEGKYRVAVAPVNTMCREMVRQGKLYPELTGNNFNHPGDMMHRIYAQTILAVLGEN